MGEAAAHGASRPDRRVRDERHRLVDAAARRARTRSLLLERRDAASSPPMRTPPSSRDERSETRESRSDRRAPPACASRKFMAGIRLCPPASGLASPACSASERERFVQRSRPVVVERRRLHDPFCTRACSSLFKRVERLLHHHPRRPIRSAAGRPSRCGRRPGRRRCTSSAYAAGVVLRASTIAVPRGIRRRPCRRSPS